jgi:hypothetical protein
MAPEQTGRTRRMRSVDGLVSNDAVVLMRAEPVALLGHALVGGRIARKTVDVAHTSGHSLADEDHMPAGGGKTIGANADAGHVDAGKSVGGHAVQG